MLQSSPLIERALAPANPAAGDAPCLLSVILPTRNESGNIEPLIERLERALTGIAVEIIFVDDSTDDTPGIIARVADRSCLPVQLIARPPGRRIGGLGGAVVEGFLAAKGIWMCVMDADLQHPPEMIPRLMSHALQSASDLVISSRFADGASTPGLDSLRSAISHAFIMSARLLFFNQLRWVTDPLTGFFLVRRDQVDLDRLHPNGFKILIEMIVQFPHLKISEVGFVMEPRYAGSSKASMHEVIRYYRKLMELRFTRGNPRFARFAAVGLSGIIVNSLALAMFTEIFHIYYLVSAVLATQLSTLWNFLLTEFWVFADRRGHSSIGIRMIGFFVLNNALLLVRGPTLSSLVQHLDVNYIIANLISIAIATVVRYLVADRLLWAQGKRGEPRAAYVKAMPLAGDVHHATE